MELEYTLHKAQCPRPAHIAWCETWAGKGTRTDGETTGRKNNKARYCRALLFASLFAVHRCKR